MDVGIALSARRFGPNVRGVRLAGRVACVIAACGLAIGGCGGGERKTGPRTELSAGDFVSDEPAATGTAAADEAATPATPPPLPGTPARNVTRTGPVAARNGVFDVAAAPGEPKLAEFAKPVEAPVLIDAKVGDVNGRPLFVTDFFESMDARLKAQARDAKSFEEFMDSTTKEIGVKLWSIVQDELLQAEARSTLTPEEKQGFRYFVQSLQSDLVSRNYRSRTIAEQRLAEAQEAASLEEWTKKREERELILYQLRSQVLQNVHIPFREIEQYYNRKYDEFNPPPLTQFRVISVPKSDAALVESIRAELEGGADFATVASKPDNLFRAKDGGLYRPPEPRAPAAKPKEGEPAPERKFFELAALNEEAKKLSDGGWSGPIDTGNTVAFLKREEIRKPATSLYEAQSAIEQTLRSKKVDELVQKYISDLLKRASVDNMDVMGERLLIAAVERYWTPIHGPEMGRALELEIQKKDESNARKQAAEVKAVEAEPE
ncbi:MAG: hypothetical protein AMXMBFR58_21100 [Phycisphaerae bacterium]